MTGVIGQIAAAFAGSLGFSIVFGLKYRYWLIVSLNGMLSWMIFLVCSLELNNFFSNLFTAVFCSLYAHIAARIVKAPTTVLLMPATVPMIPGSGLYYTIAHLLDGDIAGFQKYGYVTAETILAMAIGFALVTLFFRFYEKRLSE